MSKRMTPLQSAVDAVLHVLATTEQMAHDDVKAKRAIERATSWLKNITEPLTDAEKEELKELECRDDWIEANMDDAQDTIEMHWDEALTDEDYRDEIEWTKEANKEAENDNAPG